jgi:predicted nucleic acid-binding protein
MGPDRDAPGAVVGLLARVSELRDNLTAYDATSVALAEGLGCELVTADALAHAPGPTCAVMVVRR